MTDNRFQVLDKNSAPSQSQKPLQQAEESLGAVPNILGIMAASPQVLQGYLSINTLFAQSSLGEAEQQVVLLAASQENSCGYCVAAHSTISRHQTDMPDNVLEALRNNERLPHAGLQALKELTQEIVATQGMPAKQTVEAFFAAGYTEQNLLDVLLGVSLKTLSNYTNHIAQTPLDTMFAKEQVSEESLQKSKAA